MDEAAKRKRLKTYYVVRVAEWLWGTQPGDTTYVYSRLPDWADEYYTIRAESITEAENKHAGKVRMYPLSDY